MDNNIFSHKRGDAAGYLILYLIIPILVTYFSLKALADEIPAATYCYLTIFISAANCIYDGVNRYDETAPQKNTKLLIMHLCNIGVCVYSFAVILSMVIANEIWRKDICLLFYLGTCGIALWDIGASWVQNTTLSREIGGVPA